jgi:plastocyanin
MTKLLALLVCLAFALAACGDENEEPSDAASGPAPSAETASPEEGDGGTGGGDTGSDGESVSIVEFEFDPKDLTVKTGTQVVWTNEDSADHNVIFDGDKPKDIENLEQSESGTVTFDEAGDFAYVCSYHPGMEGSVTVE